MAIPIVVFIKVTFANFSLEFWINSNTDDSNRNYRSFLEGDLLDVLETLLKGPNPKRFIYLNK